MPTRRCGSCRGASGDGSRRGCPVVWSQVAGAQCCASCRTCTSAWPAREPHGMRDWEKFRMPAVRAAGRRRYPCSPAHRQGQHLWRAAVCGFNTWDTCQHRGDLAWGLRPRVPPPPCASVGGAQTSTPPQVEGRVVRVCGRRAHARSPRCLHDAAGVEEALRAWRGLAPGAWPGERAPGPTATLNAGTRVTSILGTLRPRSSRIPTQVLHAGTATRRSLTSSR
jgi:hypothetical protein